MCTFGLNLMYVYEYAQSLRKKKPKLFPPIVIELLFKEKFVFNPFLFTCISKQ